MPESTAEQPKPDAVGFTAGAEGAAFGAGVIHAYLAADRPAPKIVAGISFGAVNAAAMQRAYRGLATEPDETKEALRWRWFRKYLLTLSNKPLTALWEAIPDQSDFFTNRPPVRDLSRPAKLENEEEESRFQRLLLTRLGNWVGNIGVRIRTVARLLVSYVQWKESYGPFLWPTGAGLSALITSWRIMNKLIADVFLRPTPVRRDDRAYWFRPLFGWGAWTGAAVYTFLRWLVLMIAAGVIGTRIIENYWDNVLIWTALVAAVPQFLMLLWLGGFFDGAARLVGTIATHFPDRLRVLFPNRTVGGRFVINSILRNLGIHRSIIHAYTLRRALWDLFVDSGESDSPTINESKAAPHALIVAAPLQVMYQREDSPRRAPSFSFFKPRREERRRAQVAAQLWAGKDAKLVDALQAAVSMPGFLPPVQVTGDDAKSWISGTIALVDLDLVDGAVIRQNPLPALFTFLRSDDGKAIAAELESTTAHDARIHIVYAVPATPRSGQVTFGEQQTNIVDVVTLSRQLARRRDTRLEVMQTNLISRMETFVRQAGAAPVRSCIFADEIAPAASISFENPFDPTQDEMLSLAAEGCRRTLGRLYANAFPELVGLPCPELIRRVAPERQLPGAACPGVAEVCGKCTRFIQFDRPAADTEGKVLVQDDSPLVKKEVQRIVLITSGGVFRGAFHIGMLAALRWSEVKPDLIVGASVGTLMGAAYATMFTRDPKDVLRMLVDLFLQVDRRVALTRTFKSAMRELGIRGRSVNLSPRELKEMVSGGTRSDPGYAATGAPPALVDALSVLFLLSYAETRKIAASFVAGRVSEATRDFVAALKHTTLSRLDVERFLIGASLLENEIRKLIGPAAKDGVFQPFDDIAFYATSTNLGCEELRILGCRDASRAPSYDFIKAALASSAFPAVFSTVRESDIYPGIGAVDVHYGDGGMFDNLPFKPAIDILSQAQARNPTMTTAEALRKRYEMPDLFLVGALNVNPEEDTRAGGQFTNIMRIVQRAKALQENVKIRGFENAAAKIDRQIRQIIDGNIPDDPFLARIVNAAVLSVFPSSARHLNGTFAFCASTGLDRGAVRRSIADGCFRTLESLSRAQECGDLTKRTIRNLQDAGRVPVVAPRVGREGEGRCPFFTRNGDELPCPFFDSGAGAVYETCRNDATHLAAAHQARLGLTAAAAAAPVEPRRSS